MTDQETFMPPLTRIHDACAAFVAAYRTDDEDGNQVRRALADLRRALLRDREPHEDEPQWRIGVEVPMRLSDEQRHALFSAVADAVHDWEPQDRDGWDANVYGCAVAEDVRDWDEATVERVARVIHEKTWPSYPWNAIHPDAQEHNRDVARAALRAARGAS